MLRLGSRGSAVVALQKKLGITADGIFGPQTLAAVKRFQASKGLAADGVVGPLTSAKLGLSSGGSTSSTSRTQSTSRGTTSSTSWVTTSEGRAAQYGWSLAVINSNPELKRLFTTASQQNWTADRFVAAVRGTTWFKRSSDTARQAAILAKADPATYNQRISQASAQIISLARQMGVPATSSSVASWAKQAVSFGWTTDQLEQVMVRYVKPSSTGNYSGEAGQYQQQYQALAAQYGTSISAHTMGNLVRSSITGQNNPETVKKWLITLTASKYPALAERLKQGETLQQIAEPYMQAYAQTLEVNPNTIKLSDKMIQQALASKDAKGQPATKTVWQFEQDLRRDPRYMKTQQAQDDAMKMTKQVLEDWGVVG